MSNRKVPEQIKELTEEFVGQMVELYGDRLHKVILFGSYARGDFHEDSDIDYLVVLNDEEVDSYDEISFVSTITFELSLKYLMSVSAIPVSKQRLEHYGSPLLRNVRKDGILL
ncbi:nucleotidyltransferase domain-containing protein [Dyadobacter sp. LJ53]|uniref:nucleotidyltransferase domain-containing protein n=1 Tax=Dyadobacter chenwenxiniae TaxID=2906456 RepID=UPI001F3EC60A|nr:nucleotidyltransferase domain-containing protein [Dyadobacter chenwenxiniae]MCF0053732.1 nucleotidyltransferase domain-containing protein [Dyadobacter chenwenxiniae]